MNDTRKTCFILVIFQIIIDLVYITLCVLAIFGELTISPFVAFMFGLALLVEHVLKCLSI